MAFIAYFVVLLIGAAGVMFGLDLMISPLPKMPPSVHIGRPTPGRMRHAGRAPKEELKKGATTVQKALARDKAVGDRELTPVYPASPGPTDAADEVVLRQHTTGAGTQEDGVPQPDGSRTLIRPSKIEEALTPPKSDRVATLHPAPAQKQNSCNVQACSASYRSFRASDCTFQPYGGPRRLCEKSSEYQHSAAKLEHALKQQADRQALSGLPTERHNRKEVPREVAPTVRRRLAAQQAARQPSHRDDAMSETARIVRQMMRGRDVGDIAVQRADGSIIIVHTGDARAKAR